jgi:hypothetical protein
MDRFSARDAPIAHLELVLEQVLLVRELAIEAEELGLLW